MRLAQAFTLVPGTHLSDGRQIAQVRVHDRQSGMVVVVTDALGRVDVYDYFQMVPLAESSESDQATHAAKQAEAALLAAYSAAQAAIRAAREAGDEEAVRTANDLATAAHDALVVLTNR
jgi:hypothetical protein